MGRILGLATAAVLAVAASLAQVSTTSAASARFFVTGYVLRGVTATGTYVHPGTCAVDPGVIPLGSYVTIDGLGTCHAEDTGGLIIGYHIDVWVPTVVQAYALTGLYTASWGASPPQQVLGPQAAQLESAAPTPRRTPHRPVLAGRADHPRWYRHGHAYVHSATRAWVRHSVAQPTYALISRHGTGCQGARWATTAAPVRACRMAPLPPLHDIRKGAGLHRLGLGTYAHGPLARGHTARPHLGVTPLRANRNHPRMALLLGGDATSSIAGRSGKWQDAGVPPGERVGLWRPCAARAGVPSGERPCRSTFSPAAKAGGSRRIELMKIVRSVVATEVVVPLVWLLPITVLAFVSTAAALVMVMRLYMKGLPGR